jgi:TonB family protein
MTGMVLLSVAVDACGRVTDARIVQSSDTQALDEAALEAARSWIVKSSDGTVTADGRRDMPVEFAIEGDAQQKAIKFLGWPRTHRHARYLADIDDRVDSVAHARDALGAVDEARIGAPPYDGWSGMFIATGTDAAPEFWLFPAGERFDGIAVRYRPRTEHGEPVVRTLVVCEKTETLCQAYQGFFLGGLPFR